MPLQSDPAIVLFAAVRAYLLAAHPGFPIQLLDRLKLIARDGNELKIPAVFESPPRAAASSPAPSSPVPTKSPGVGPLSEMEDCIIEALGDKTMTGQEIADAAGYPFERSLRACLAAMRRHGILTGEKGDPGYSVAVNP